MNQITQHTTAIGLIVLLIKWNPASGALPPQVDDAGRPITAASQPLPLHPGRWIPTELGEMPLPVFDSGVTIRRDRLACLGGFTHKLETTKAIQIHYADAEWLPIGSQMIEPRAWHTITPLADGNRVLITGGVRGTLGGTLTALASCEVLDPFIAGSRQVPPLEEPLFGHTAHLLSDGRIAVIGGSAVRIFDADAMQWTASLPLHHPRRHHESLILPGDLLVIIGGDEAGSIESIRLSESEPAAVLWKETLGGAYRRQTALGLSDGRILLAGGVDDQTGASTDRTWLLDPARQWVRSERSLQISGGVADPAVFAMPQGVAVVGGETVNPRDRSACNQPRLLDLEIDRLFALPPIPDDASRRFWYRSHDGAIEAVGGYHFLSQEDAERSNRLPGVQIPTMRWRLDLRSPALIAAD